MGFFTMLFWIAVLWLAYRWFRGSERCVAVGPRGYAPGWYDRHRPEPVERPRSDAQQEYIESLESRLSDLEERLDFTERLLASKRVSEVGG
jgi:hypothetical protein